MGENDPGVSGGVAGPAACLDCGLPYADFPLDLNLPRAQWLAIHPEGENGLLCAACIVRRAAKIPGDGDGQGAASRVTANRHAPAGSIPADSLPSDERRTAYQAVARAIVHIVFARDKWESADAVEEFADAALRVEDMLRVRRGGEEG